MSYELPADSEVFFFSGQRYPGPDQFFMPHASNINIMLVASYFFGKV